MLLVVICCQAQPYFPPFVKNVKIGTKLVLMKKYPELLKLLGKVERHLLRKAYSCAFIRNVPTGSLTPRVVEIIMASSKPGTRNADDPSATLYRRFIDVEKASCVYWDLPI